MNTTGELLLEMRDMIKRLEPFIQNKNILESHLEEPILIEAAAECIKKSRHTLYGYIRDAKKEKARNPDAIVFPFHKCSHKGLYFFKSELITYIQNHKK